MDRKLANYRIVLLNNTGINCLDYTNLTVQITVLSPAKAHTLKKMNERTPWAGVVYSKCAL